MSACGPIRLLIADDYAPFASSVEELLAQEESVEVVGIARDGVQAVELAALLEPDVVLLDVDMPRLDGFEAAERIRDQNPETRIVIITGEARDGNSARARELGTSGYMLKADVDEELLSAIRAEAAA